MMIGKSIGKHIEIEQLRLALDNVPSYVYIKDESSRYLYANKLTLELFGCNEETLLELSDQDFFPPDVVTKLREVDLRVLQGECTQEEIVVDNPDHSKTYYWEVKTPVYSTSEPDKVIGVLGISTDITHSKVLEKKLFEAATTDALTGLLNRNIFFERLSLAQQNSQHQGTHGAVIFIDLDRFKHLNDNFGHQAGDQHLIVVARRIKNVIRKSDTAARFGGDEFVVLLEGLDPSQCIASQQARDIEDKIRKELNRSYLLNDSVYQGSGSTGISLFFGAQRSTEEILAEADRLMYDTKRNRT